MADLIPKSRSAWFSVSVPRSKRNIWFESGGSLEPDPFQADFLYAENSEAIDVQRIFNSEEFLTGHLTVFQSDMIKPAATNEVVRLDTMNKILLPWKQLDELGITLTQCFRENCRDTKTYKKNQSSDCSEPENPSKQIHMSTPKNSQYHTISKISTTQDEVPEITVKRAGKSSQQFTSGTRSDHFISQFSPTPSKTSVHRNIDDNHTISKTSTTQDGEITFIREEKPSQQSTSGTRSDYFILEFSPIPSKTSVHKDSDGANRNSGIFYHSLNFDITHVDDVNIPHVRLMDFKPGVDGCHVVKRHAMLCEKHSS